MADVITLSSSDEEDTIKPRPIKRLKPTPVLIPSVTITKIVKKKQDVVVLCSDDDDDGIKDDNSIEKNKNKTNCAVTINGTSLVRNNLDSVIQISDDIPEPKPNSSIGSIEINDSNDERLDDTVLIKDLEDSCEIINEDGEENSSRIENSDIDEAGSSKCTSKLPNTILLGKLLKVIDNQIKDTKYNVIKPKFSLLLNYYDKCKVHLGDSPSFDNLLTSCHAKAQSSPMGAVISFKDVYSHIKDLVNAESIHVDRRQYMELKKLESTIKKLLHMIHTLENEDIDFELEEDTSYLKLERYIRRLDQVHKKYCSLLNKNPYAGRLTYSKLDFVDSEYNEINRAISKKFKNNKTFPSYYEMEKLIKKVVKDSKLDLNESKIKTESVNCFKRLGELLQVRRRKELYDIHNDIIKQSDDPAKLDTELNETLKTNYTEGQLKIEKLVSEYVDKQENKQDDNTESSEEDEESDKSDSVKSVSDSDEDDGAGNG